MIACLIECPFTCVLVFALVFQSDNLGGVWVTVKDPTSYQQGQMGGYGSPPGPPVPGMMYPGSPARPDYRWVLDRDRVCGVQLTSQGKTSNNRQTPLQTIGLKSDMAKVPHNKGF